MSTHAIDAPPARWRAPTPSTRHQLDGVVVWSFTARFSQHGRVLEKDSRVDVRTGTGTRRWSPTTATTASSPTTRAAPSASRGLLNRRTSARRASSEIRPRGRGPRRPSAPRPYGAPTFSRSSKTHSTKYYNSCCPLVYVHDLVRPKTAAPAAARPLLICPQWQKHRASLIHPRARASTASRSARSGRSSQIN